MKMPWSPPQVHPDQPPLDNPPQPDGIAIHAEGLTRYFGNFLAVDHVSFTVWKGEVVGYLGPNGSGKTTTMRMLLGLLRPSDGTAQVLGYHAFRQSEQVRANVGYMSQKFALYHELTVAENLAFYAGVYGIRERSRLEEVLDLVELRSFRDQRVSSLSVGWRQRLALATAIVHRPRLLFLDEPTSGVDPLARRAFWDLIYKLVEGGVTALVTTHYMDEAEYCGRVGIMRDGRLLALDTPSSLKTNALPGLAWDVFVTPASQEDEGLAAPIPAQVQHETAILEKQPQMLKNSVIQAIEVLQRCPCVLRVGLVSDHLRAITPAGVTANDLASAIAAADGGSAFSLRVEQVEPTLEDVFLALAGKG
ncbi:MAG: ABC transporter ATP-binding protein [Anaerolineales bacterium]|nr:ABC transporter ATP-binding protein [Anaerolineales bacterium]